VQSSLVNVVVDINVWISGLLSRTGPPAQLTRLVVQQGQPLFSAQTFAELKERLWRPKFDRFVTIEQRKRFLNDLESIALWVEVPASMAAIKYSRDAADDMFIHAALAGRATWLVTGDDDLLTLHPLGALQIISPRKALEGARGIIAPDV